MYFITPAYIERYIDSKNPGTCEIRTTYATNEIIRNTSTDEHLTPNGKIYDIEKEGNRYFSPQMEVRKNFTNINLLRQYLTEKNPLSTLRTYSKIEHQETYTATVSYQKTFTIYQTDKGRMSDTLPAETYFATAQELKTYINQHLR
ncbi:MAG: hypothetical protein LBG59_06760 [Candidatus Peribacteria bacterium]|jgi:hypothetical protein|nr:hypothetical protein [Candidatus Peribacteria bacterium]